MLCRHDVKSFPTALERCQACAQMSAGGSLSNTLVALARLSAAHERRDGQLNVAAASVSGGDVLGEYYRNQLVRAGVAMLAEPLPGSSTGARS